MARYGTGTKTGSVGGRKSKSAAEAIPTRRCVCCQEDLKESEFYGTNSMFYNKKIPICKSCIETCYKKYYRKYREEKRKKPDRDAIKRVCMIADIYFSNAIYEMAMKNIETKQPDILPIFSYLKIVKLQQYSKKTYDDTLIDEAGYVALETQDDDEDEYEILESTIKFFGKGFSAEDYYFLQEQYNDWTTRHECNTKSQEEVFKQICFTQLKILKAEKKGEDTKDLNATFLKQLEAAKLQPKQNSGDSVTETQTFGTLIDKWETTEPVPEVDPDLKDVDKIGLYLDVFFRGHLAKMMGLKNGLSNLYNKVMKKYTVEKPEYAGDDNSEVLFDAIFGNQSLIDE